MLPLHCFFFVAMRQASLSPHPPLPSAASLPLRILGGRMPPPLVKSSSGGRDSLPLSSLDQLNSTGGWSTNGNHSTSTTNGFLWPSSKNRGSSTSNHGGSHHHNRVSADLSSFRSSFHEGMLIYPHGGDHRGKVKLNDIVGSGISGKRVLGFILWTPKSGKSLSQQIFFVD